jgi:drug/metabolite transporter (DMT)-like permease
MNHRPPAGSSFHFPAGAGYSLVAAALFGASTPAAKVLMGQISPILLAGVLYLGSGIGLGSYWLSRKRSEARVCRADLPPLAGAVLAGGVLAPVLLMFGLQMTPATTTSLLLNLEGVLTACLAWFVFNENFDRRIMLGMIAITAGGALLSWSGRPEWRDFIGPSLVFSACLCWALDNNLTRKVSAADPIQIAAIKGLVGGTVNCCLAFALGAHATGIFTTLGAAAVGFFGYGVSLVLFIVALRQLGTARTGAYYSTAPFMGALISILVLQEPLTAWVVVAGLLMTAGVWLHLTEQHEHVHVHDEVEHEHLHVHDEHHQHAHAPTDPPGEPHSHRHHHEKLAHAHAHYPDTHHRHLHH